MNDCKHRDNMSTGFDHHKCHKCGWVMPDSTHTEGGKFIGIHEGWFPSMEAFDAFKRFGTYPGMNNLTEPDWPKIIDNIGMKDRPLTTTEKIQYLIQNPGIDRVSFGLFDEDDPLEFCVDVHYRTGGMLSRVERNLDEMIDWHYQHSFKTATGREKRND